MSYPVYVSDQKFEDCMDLLLTSNEQMKINHTMCISKILTDLCVIKQKTKIKKTFANVVYHVSVVKQLAVSFKIYAHFESLLKGVQSSDKNNSSYTEKYQDHIPCSFAYKVVCIDNKFSKNVVLYT